jgi:putative ABC transport system ATP-binding protein
MNPAPVVELADIDRAFDAGSVTALSGVSLTIYAGESVAIVGPSGSGKSTLLNIMCGLDRPTRGTVRLLGRAVAGARAWTELRGRHIGIVFQNFHLLPTLSASENVEAAMMGRVAPAMRRARARDLLAQLGLAHVAAQAPARLSGGERQRVAIARALANAPQILVADEPTGSLDRASAQVVMKALLAAHRVGGHALVIVTHDVAVAAECARRIEIVDGHVVSDVPTLAAAQ